MVIIVSTFQINVDEKNDPDKVLREVSFPMLSGMVPFIFGPEIALKMGEDERRDLTNNWNKSVIPCRSHHLVLYRANSRTRFEQVRECCEFADTLRNCSRQICRH